MTTGLPVSPLYHETQPFALLLHDDRTGDSVDGRFLAAFACPTVVPASDHRRFFMFWERPERRGEEEEAHGGRGNNKFVKRPSRYKNAKGKKHLSMSIPQ
jgi:hypothetical protein